MSVLVWPASNTEHKKVLVGRNVGPGEGTGVGLVGPIVGRALGWPGGSVGLAVGSGEGPGVGTDVVGCSVGMDEGLNVGTKVGHAEGCGVPGAVGARDTDTVGRGVGAAVGARLGAGDGGKLTSVTEAGPMTEVLPVQAVEPRQPCSITYVCIGDPAGATNVMWAHELPFATHAAGGGTSPDAPVFCDASCCPAAFKILSKEVPVQKVPGLIAAHMEIMTLSPPPA